MIEIEGIDHLVLKVRDIDSSLQFYCEVLGCSEERRVESLGLVQLRAGNCLIDLIPSNHDDQTKCRNLDHFCLRIKSFDNGRIRSYLHDHGVTFGETAQRYGAKGYGPSIYIKDPDGNTVELKG